MLATTTHRIFAVSATLLLLSCEIGCESAQPTAASRAHAATGARLNTDGEDEPATADQQGEELRASIDLKVGGENGLDIAIGNDVADSESSAVDVEVGGAKGVKVDFESN